MTRSAVYVGSLMHERRGAVANHFRYGVCSYLLDLDELDDLDRRVAGFGYNRSSLATFRDRDHIGDPTRPVKENIHAWLAERGVALDGGRILLLTNLRVFGYLFNPVSFFYCYCPGWRAESDDRRDLEHVR